MPTQKSRRTPLVDAFIHRAAEGMADATWCDQHGQPIIVTEEDVERCAGAAASPETIEEAKRLARGGSPSQETQ